MALLTSVSISSTSFFVLTQFLGVRDDHLGQRHVPALFWAVELYVICLPSAEGVLAETSSMTWFRMMASFRTVENVSPSSGLSPVLMLVY